MASSLTSLQDQVVTRLEGQTFFSGAPSIPVIAENRRDLLTAVQTTLGKLGVCVVVGTPTARQDRPSLHTPPHFSRINLVCQVIENVLLNRAASGTGQPGSLVAEAVAYHLTGWAPDIFANGLLIESIEPVTDEQYAIWEVTHFTGGALTQPSRQT